MGLERKGGGSGFKSEDTGRQRQSGGARSSIATQLPGREHTPEPQVQAPEMDSQDSNEDTAKQTIVGDMVKFTGPPCTRLFYEDQRKFLEEENEDFMSCGSCCDLVIYCSGGYLSIHRGLLLAVSNLVQDLKSPTEGQSNIVKREDLDFREFTIDIAQKLFTVLYLGYCPIQELQDIIGIQRLGRIFGISNFTLDIASPEEATKKALNVIRYSPEQRLEIVRKITAPLESAKENQVPVLVILPEPSGVPVSKTQAELPPKVSKVVHPETQSSKKQTERLVEGMPHKKVPVPLPQKFARPARPQSKESKKEQSEGSGEKSLARNVVLSEPGGLPVKNTLPESLPSTSSQEEQLEPEVVPPNPTSSKEQTERLVEDMPHKKVSVSLPPKFPRPARQDSKTVRDRARASDSKVSDSSQASQSTKAETPISSRSVKQQRNSKIPALALTTNRNADSVKKTLERSEAFRRMTATEPLTEPKVLTAKATSSKEQPERLVEDMPHKKVAVPLPSKFPRPARPHSTESKGARGRVRTDDSKAAGSSVVSQTQKAKSADPVKQRWDSKTHRPTAKKPDTLTPNQKVCILKKSKGEIRLAGTITKSHNPPMELHCFFCDQVLHSIDQLDAHLNRSSCASHITKPYSLENKECGYCSERFPKMSHTDFMGHLHNCEVIHHAAGMRVRGRMSVRFDDEIKVKIIYPYDSESDEDSESLQSDLSGEDQDVTSLLHPLSVLIPAVCFDFEKFRKLKLTQAVHHKKSFRATLTYEEFKTPSGRLLMLRTGFDGNPFDYDEAWRWILSKESEPSYMRVTVPPKRKEPLKPVPPSPACPMKGILKSRPVTPDLTRTTSGGRTLRKPSTQKPEADKKLDSTPVPLKKVGSSSSARNTHRRPIPVSVGTAPESKRTQNVEEPAPSDGTGSSKKIESSTRAPSTCRKPIPVSGGTAESKRTQNMEEQAPSDSSGSSKKMGSSTRARSTGRKPIPVSAEASPESKGIQTTVLKDVEKSASSEKGGPAADPSKKTEMSSTSKKSTLASASKSRARPAAVSKDLSRPASSEISDVIAGPSKKMRSSDVSTSKEPMSGSAANPGTHQVPPISTQMNFGRPVISRGISTPAISSIPSTPRSFGQPIYTSTPFPVSTEPEEPLEPLTADTIYNSISCVTGCLTRHIRVVDFIKCLRSRGLQICLICMDHFPKDDKECHTKYLEHCLRAGHIRNPDLNGTDVQCPVTSCRKLTRFSAIGSHIYKDHGLKDIHVKHIRQSEMTNEDVFASASLSAAEFVREGTINALRENFGLNPEPSPRKRRESAPGAQNSVGSYGHQSKRRKTKEEKAEEGRQRLFDIGIKDWPTTANILHSLASSSPSVPGVSTTGTQPHLPVSVITTQETSVPPGHDSGGVSTRPITGASTTAQAQDTGLNDEEALINRPCSPLRPIIESIDPVCPPLNPEPSPRMTPNSGGSYGDQSKLHKTPAKKFEEDKQRLLDTGTKGWPTTAKILHSLASPTVPGVSTTGTRPPLPVSATTTQEVSVPLGLVSAGISTRPIPVFFGANVKGVSLPPGFGLAGALTSVPPATVTTKFRSINPFAATRTLGISSRPTAPVTGKSIFAANSDPLTDAAATAQVQDIDLDDEEALINRPCSPLRPIIESIEPVCPPPLFVPEEEFTCSDCELIFASSEEIEDHFCFTVDAPARDRTVDFMSDSDEDE